MHPPRKMVNFHALLESETFIYMYMKINLNIFSFKENSNQYRKCIPRTQDNPA